MIALFIVGFIVRTFGLKVNANGVSYIRYVVSAHNTAKQDVTTKKGNRSYVTLTAFGKDAEFLSRNFTVNSPICIEAEPRNNNYMDANGLMHYEYEFVTKRLGFAGYPAQPGQAASVEGGQFFQPVSGSAQASTPAFSSPQVAVGEGVQPYAQPVQTASVAGGQSFQPVPGSTQVSTPAFGIPQVAAGGCAQFPAGSPASNAPEQGIILRKLEDVFTQGEMKIVDSDESADE